MCIIFTYQDMSISNLSSKLVPSLSSVNCSSKKTSVYREKNIPIFAL